jgi:phospho-N-acetylmuramoyl-pentapeptide-transferase
MNIPTSLMYAVIISMAASLVLGPFLIRLLQRIKLGQNIREEGPESHHIKAGTPTMGGVLIIFAVLAGTIPLAWRDPDVLFLLFVFVCYGGIGFLDDLLKTWRRQSLGLRAWQKLLLQIIVATFFSLYVFFVAETGQGVFLPFMAEPFNLGIWIIPLIVLTMLATTNAVNLTDGLDGLAAGLSGIAFIAMVPILLSLWMPYFALTAVAAVAACVGFIWYNFYPAQIFMGDTGSLALGGLLAGIACLSGTEFFLFFTGGVFVLEALSVIIQVSYFKYSNGRRIFRMSPLHHHFELVGWPETKVVIRFWILSIGLSAAGVFVYFL